MALCCPTFLSTRSVSKAFLSSNGFLKRKRAVYTGHDGVVLCRAAQPRLEQDLTSLRTQQHNLGGTRESHFPIRTYGFHMWLQHFHGVTSADPLRAFTIPEKISSPLMVARRSSNILCICLKDPALRVAPQTGWIHPNPGSARGDVSSGNGLLSRQLSVVQNQQKQVFCFHLTRVNSVSDSESLSNAKMR